MSDQKQPEDPLTEEFEKSEIFAPEEPVEETLHEENNEEAPEEEDATTLETIQLRQELKAEKDKYFRLLAEMENTRKRMQKEKEDMSRFSQEKVIVEFLAPLDNYENALMFAEQGSEEVKNWAKGFEMILTQFKDILAAHNVSQITTKDNKFDPHLHEVIEMEETDAYEEGTILKEFAKGYKCGDRIIRPARIKIAKKQQAETNATEEQKEKEQNNE